MKPKAPQKIANTLRQECVHSKASLHLDCTVCGTKAAFVGKEKETKHEGLNNTALSLSHFSMQCDHDKKRRKHLEESHNTSNTLKKAENGSQGPSFLIKLRWGRDTLGNYKGLFEERTKNEKTQNCTAFEKSTTNSEPLRLPSLSRARHLACPTSTPFL